jgi:hypothetical protein
MGADHVVEPQFLAKAVAAFAFGFRVIRSSMAGLQTARLERGRAVDPIPI